MNWYIFMIAVILAYFENKYFGWNATPKTDAEMICDILIGIVFALAFLGQK